MSIKFNEGSQVVLLQVGEHVVNTASNYVKVRGAHWVTFLVALGDADTDITFTVESSSANSSNASEAQVGFNYRKSGAASAGSDTYSAITWASGDVGVVFSEATDTGKIAIIDVDPAGLTAGHEYMRVVPAATAYSGVTPALAVIAVIEPRYMSQEHASAT